MKNIQSTDMSLFRYHKLAGEYSSNFTTNLLERCQTNIFSLPPLFEMKPCDFEFLTKKTERKALKLQPQALV